MQSGFAERFRPSGSLVAYACAATELAAERGGQGIFTKHLLQHLATPGLNIIDVFVLVGQGVEEETKHFKSGKQRPVVTQSLRILTSQACLVSEK